jgi:hypothetical protein
MIEIIFGALIALSIRDIFYEAIERYNHYRHKKDVDVFFDLVEDFEADDD